MVSQSPPPKLPALKPQHHTYICPTTVSVLDRILLAYQLGVDIDQRKSRQESKHKKLCCLFEFLGADHLEVREEDPHHARHERSGVNW